MNQTKARRFIIQTLRITGGSLAALLLAAAGLLIWLRTGSAERFLTGQMAEILAEQGLILESGRISGPLPGRLTVRDLALSDTKGEFLTVEELGVELRLWSLLSGTLEIRRARLRKADLIRLPQLPPSGPSAAGKGAFKLPFNLILGHLRAEDNRIRFGAFNPGRAGDSKRDLNFEARGRASLKGRRLRADLEAALTGAGQEGARLTIRLEPQAGDRADDGPYRPERLFLELAVSEAAGGWLAALLDFPDWPDYSLKLAGDGPLTGWRGRLDLSAGHPGAEIAALGADLAWRGASGELWRDAVARPGFRTSLEAELRLGPQAPAVWRELAGRQLTASLNLAREPAGYFGGGQLQTGLWNLSLADFYFNPTENGALGLTLAGLIPDLDQLQPAWGRPAAAGGPVKALTLTSRFRAEVANGQKEFNLQGRLEARPRAEGEKPWPLAFTLNLAEGPERTRLGRLILSGLGLSVQADGDYLKATRGGAANLRASLAAGGLWRDLALQLTNRNPAEFFDGQVELKLKADWPDPASPAQGELQLEARELTWPQPKLRALLGPRLRLTAGLAGGGGQPYRLHIKEAEAGLLALTGRAAFEPAMGGDLPAAFKGGRFELEAQVELADLGSLAAGWKGPLTARLKADGKLPAFSAALTAGSPSLKMPSGELRELDSALTAEGGLTGAGAFQAAGLLTAQAQAAPGGPVTVSSAWSFASGAGRLEAALKKAVVDGGGLKLAADLTGQLDTALKNGQLSGELELAVQSWPFLAALSGWPLAGRPAWLRAGFERTGNRQNARLTWNLPELAWRGEPGRPDLLTLRDLNGDLKANDLFQAPRLEFNLTSGAGQAGPLGWASGAASVTGSGEAGELKIFFRQARGGRELVDIQGRYHLSEFFSLTLNRFNLAWPGSQSGLRLEKPLLLAWADGLEVKNLNAALSPGGSLKGEAAFKGRETRIKAALQDLPFSFFKAFADAPWPEGTVRARLDLNGSPGRAGGDFNLSAAMKTAARDRGGEGLTSVVLGLDGRLNGSSLRGSGQLRLGAQGDEPVELTYLLPLIVSSSGRPQPDLNGPLSANLKWRGSLRRIWRILPLPDRTLTGQGQINLSLGGSLNRIKPEAQIHIADGRYEDLVLGLLLNDIKLEAQSARDGSIRVLASAGDAHEGRVALEAFLRPGETPRSPFRLAARAHFIHLRPIQRDDLSLQFSGLAGAHGPLTAPAVTGRLVVEQGEFSLLTSLGGGSIRTLPLTEGDDPKGREASGGGTCDVDIVVPRQFYVRGRGLDSEWRGNLKLKGPLSGPVLTGSIKPVRGHFELLSKEFAITSGDIRFSGGPRLNPGLHLEMTHTGPRLTAVALVEGTANHPRMTLSSRPPLPRDEVLAQVLFGKSASDLSRFEALQLAQGLRELAGLSRGDFNPITTARKTLGLDVLRIGSGRGESAASRASDLAGSRDVPGGPEEAARNADDDIMNETTIEVGKYISDNVYVGLEQGLDSGGTGVRVEVELRPNLSLEGRTSADSSQVGLGWKKDY